MRNFKLFCLFSEVEGVLVIDFDESFLAVLLLGSKGANEGVNLLVAELLANVAQVIEVFFLDYSEPWLEVFLLPLFERLSHNQV